MGKWIKARLDDESTLNDWRPLGRIPWVVKLRKLKEQVQLFKVRNLSQFGMRYRYSKDSGKNIQYVGPYKFLYSWELLLEISILEFPVDH